MSSTRRFPCLIEIITVIGVILYISRSFYFANTSLSIGDEGAYLYKGYLFARGDYQPFQDYGFWTNKAPLAFLIPGYVQYWFGAGLRQARYFSMAVSFLMLAALWITSNRLGGKMWAALVVWVFALSDASTSIYSQALSQGLVACMLSWVFASVLGENRPLWQVIVASVLSVLIVMTRQNMIVLPPLLVMYIFWQHGKIAGQWAILSSAVLFLGFHALYWPNILQLWAPWLPDSLTPFLDDFRPFTTFGYDSWVVGNLSRIQSVATGIQYHFFILCGFACALILFPKRSDWKSRSQFKSAVFLGLAFLSLFVMHTWASLYNLFCVQCFSPYQMFYMGAGVLFIVAVFSNGVAESKFREGLLVVTLLFFAGGLGLYYFQTWGDWALSTLRIPLVNRMFLEGKLVWASLRDVFTYAMNLPSDIQKRAASALIGVLAGMILLMLSWLIHRFYATRNRPGGVSAVNIPLCLFLMIGTLVPPALNRSAYSSPCSTNFLSYYEQAGKSLSEVIPSGSLVYWKGSGRHLALMLYLDDIQIFPPQITAGAGYVLAGDPDRLLRFGLFDDKMDMEWRKSADFFILWQDYPNTKLSDFQNDEEYEAVQFDMKNLAGCEEPLYLFRKHL